MYSKFISCPIQTKRIGALVGKMICQEIISAPHTSDLSMLESCMRFSPFCWQYADSGYDSKFGPHSKVDLEKWSEILSQFKLAAACNTKIISIFGTHREFQFWDLIWPVDFTLNLQRECECCSWSHPLCKLCNFLLQAFSSLCEFRST